MIKKIYKSILAIIIGHITVLKHAFKKRVTLEYPEVKPLLNDKFRGEHLFDINKCKACGMCQKVCPANAITIIKDENGLNEYSIDYKKCIFCGNCYYYCNFNAIMPSSNFELACSSKESLVITFKKAEEA
ncbi:4Fe-4S binding protein [bacterium]|nr:4Fe-4S binding protein [bacterium]